MVLGYTLAILASALWGLTYVLDQKVLSSLSVFKLYFLHSCFGVMIAGLILLFQGQSLTELFSYDATKLSVRIVTLTLLVGAVASLAIFGSIQTLGAAKASILEISYPFFVAIFSFLLFRETITLPVLIGGLFIFLGAVIIVVAS